MEPNSQHGASECKIQINLGVPSGNLTQLLEMAIYSWFTH